MIHKLAYIKAFSRGILKYQQTEKREEKVATILTRF
jgi:hypothetical protein